MLISLIIREIQIKNRNEISPYTFENVYQKRTQIATVGEYVEKETPAHPLRGM